MVDNFVDNLLQINVVTTVLRTMIVQSIFFDMRSVRSQIAKAKAKEKAMAVTRKRFLWALSHMQKSRNETKLVKSLKGLLRLVKNILLDRKFVLR